MPPLFGKMFDDECMMEGNYANTQGIFAGSGAAITQFKP